MGESKRKKGFFGRLFGGKEAPPSAEPEQTEASVEVLEADQAPDISGSQAVVDGPMPSTDAPAEESEKERVEPVKNASDVEEQPEALQEPADTSEEALVVEETIKEPAPAENNPPEKSGSWFQRLTRGLTRSSGRLTQSIADVLTKRKLDADTLEELEDVLLQADLGMDTALAITDAIKDGRFESSISAEDVQKVLADEVASVLEPVAVPFDVDRSQKPFVVLMIGVNGAGKTTTIGKLSKKMADEGMKVTLGAGDTFRAAAIEQIKVWGERTGAEVIARDQGADAAGLAFDAIAAAKENGSDVLFLDTAGRLQNRAELMAELEKVVRVIKKQDATAPHAVLLVLDATVGQNAIQQVEIFSKVAGVTGIIMTKLDGTAKGGILVAIARKFGLPIHFIGVGEGVEDLQPFDSKEFSAAIAGLADIS